MNSTALALVLCAAVAHALWNFAAKRVEADAVVFVWSYVVASLAVWGPVALVWMAVHDQRPTWWWLIGGVVSGLLHLVYSLVLQHGYLVGDLNLVYPLARGTGPLVTMAVAIALLGERPGTLAIVGGIIIVAGIAVITFGGGHASRSRRRAGVIWGCATGLTIASYTLWDDHSVNALAVPPLAYYLLTLLTQAVALTPVVHARSVPVGPVVRRHWREVLTVAVLSPLAYVLVLVAMQKAPVALVAPARETSIVLGALLAWLVLREPRPARRLVGAAIVLVGIAALVV